MTKSDEVIEKARKMYKSDCDVERLMEFLCENNISQGVTVYLMKTLGVGDILQCQKLINESSIWRRHYENQQD